MRRTSARSIFAALAILLGVAASGCSPRLPPAETFHWGELPVSFSPPPSDWERGGQGSAGLRGSYFLKRWEGMGVAEYYLVGDRDRRFALETLLDRFDSFDDHRLRWEIQIAHCRTDDPLSPAERSVAAEVNEALDRANLSQIRGETEAARTEVAEALAASRRLKLSLDDVLDRVVFRPERRQEPERYRLLGQRNTQVAGLPAVAVDFTLRSDERPYWGREVYFMKDNHLFVASYQGGQRNLALFDAVVATISFPPRAAIRAAQ